MYYLLTLLLNGIRLLFNGIFIRIWTYLVFILPFFLTKIIGFLGIGLIGYTGMDFVIDAVFVAVTNAYDSIGTDLLIMLNLLGIFTGFKIIFAAMSAVLSIKLLNSVRKLSFKSKPTFEA
jgi:hypothetical protein